MSKRKRIADPPTKKELLELAAFIRKNAGFQSTCVSSPGSEPDHYWINGRRKKLMENALRFQAKHVE